MRDLEGRSWRCGRRRPGPPPGNVDAGVGAGWSLPSSRCWCWASSRVGPRPAGGPRTGSARDPAPPVTVQAGPASTGAGSGARMADVRGLTAADARQVLVDLGFGDAMVTKKQEPSVGTPSTVVAQDPSAGSPLGNHFGLREELNRPFNSSKAAGHTLDREIG